MNSFPPLTRVALDPRRRSTARRDAGAFPESEEALTDSSETFSLLRPYTPDLVGWFEDFSGTGAYDAAGGFSRSQLNLTEILYGPEPADRPVQALPGRRRRARLGRQQRALRARAGRLQCEESQRAVPGP